MTRPTREQLNAETIERTRKHLRQNLCILKVRSDEDKAEIEARVMAEIEDKIASVSDSAIEHESSLQSFQSDADTLAFSVLQEQDLRREMRHGW